MGACFIVVGLLAVCSLSFGQECRQELLENVDFPGSDITSLYSPDANHCQQLCTQHPSCKFFTFVRPDWTNDDRHFFCYIKNTADGQPQTQTVLQGVTSGFSLKRCQPSLTSCMSQVYQNVDFFGSDYRALFTSDHEECQRACTKDPGCQFFAYVNENYSGEKIRYKCHLKFSWPIPTTPIVERTAGVVSGFSHSVPLTQSFSTTCKSKLFPSTDIPGNNVTSLPAVSPEHCQVFCSAHPLCTFFSYSSDDLKCHLKNNPNEMVAKPQNGVTSGIPARFCQLDNSWTKVAHEGIDFRGSDVLAEENILDAKVCQTTCNVDRHCQFYAYVNENFSDPKYWRRCYIKRVITMPAPSKINKQENVVSGFTLRGCQQSLVAHSHV